MQSSLWKLGALLGVIGAGFLVLLKAQQEMTQQTSAPETFSELDAIDDLADLDAGQASETDAPSASSGSPSYSASPSSINQPPGGDSRQRVSTDPFGAFVADQATAEQREPSSADELADASSVEPLEDLAALFGEEPPGVSDTERAQNPVTSEEPADPFGVFPTLAEEESRSAGSEPTFDAAPEPTLADASAETGQPEGVFPNLEALAPGDETASGFSIAGEQQDEPAAAENPVEEEATAVSNSLTEPLEPTLAVDETDEQSAADEFQDAGGEPISLTALPPYEAGPALSAPPQQLEEPAPTPVLPEPTQEDELNPADGASQIALASAEQTAASGEEPNQFLVFPGADESPTAEPRNAAPPSKFPDVSPEPAGRAWVGDASPQIGDTEPAAAEPIEHSDGTREMTIMPRNGEPHTVTLSQPGDEGASPFEIEPRHQPARDMPSPRPQLAPLARVPASPAASERPRVATAEPHFPTLRQSQTKEPVQPLSAEIPHRETETDNQLTSADFVGVGTISPDTPSTPQQAQLTIEKQAPGNATLGQELIYSIIVKNIGRSTANNVIVEDLVPKGTELQGTDPQARMTPEKKLLWQLGAMKPGASRTIRIKVIPTQAGQIGSVATVSFEAAVASRTVIVAPQLRLSMHGPDEVRVGEKAPYKFTLTNIGTADASNVYVRSIIPAGFEHPAAQKRNGVTDIEYHVGTLARGESREVELTLLAVEEGQFQNHAIMNADGNVNVESRHAVKVIASRLKIQREGPANRVVGSEARFVNSVSNESSRVLERVTVSEVIPVGLKFVQATDEGYYNAQTRMVTWQLKSLEPGGLRRLQTVVLPESAGKMSTKVTAVDQLGDEAEASSTLNVAGFSSLTVDVSNPARAIPVGEEVALRLKVRNGGTAAASKVETRVQLPPELKFVSAQGPVRYAQQGEWIAFEPIERIDIQGEQTFDIVLAANSASQDARVVVQLTSRELTRPLSEDESVVIYADGP